MSTRKPPKSRMTPRSSPIQTHPSEEATNNLPETEVLNGINSDEMPTEKCAPTPSLSAYFLQNYITSMAFHAYIAFVPAILQPILRRNPPFSKWSSNAVTVLCVFVANASWMEFFGFKCTADAGAAFIAAVQEKRIMAVSGSSLPPTTKRMLLLGAISGLLGAMTVGLLIAFLSGLNPFGGILPLPQEVFRLLENREAEPSILVDIMDAAGTIRQKALASAFIQTVASVVGSSHTMFATFTLDLQHMLQSGWSYQIFRAFSLLFDTFVAEFLCCFVVYSVSAVCTSAGFYLELRHIQRLNLAVLLFAVVAGLPFCTVVGGPMLGISFAALVAGCRLDPWCFVLTASADFLAAVGATVWVGPVAHALPTVRALTVKKGT